MAGEYTSIPVAKGDYKRLATGEPNIVTFNRFYESNPTNLETQVAMLLRPGLARRTVVGDGPIRVLYNQTGSFDDDLMVVSADRLYRVHRAVGMADSVTICTEYLATGSEVIGGNGAPEMTSPANDVLFLADGLSLKYMQDDNVLHPVATPDAVGMISVDTIAGYTICVVTNSDRFYWINPGEFTIDNLNFATAERAPDHIQNVRVIGDQIWFFGKGTTEVWFVTGDALAPFQRTQGRLFDKGVWQGTAVAMPNQDVTILVGMDGIVYEVSGGPRIISNHGLEERIRTAMIAQEQEDGY